MPAPITPPLAATPAGTASPLPPPAAPDPVAGVLWMVASGLAFIGVNTIVRLIGADLPAAEQAFIRFVFGTVLLLPVLVPLLRQGLPPGTTPAFLWRSALHVAAVMLWFHAMARLPIAEVTAIGYLNPVVVTVGAALFLGERLALRRIAAIAVALAGAMVVLRPGLREVTGAHWAQLGASLFFGLSYLVAKRLSDLAPAATVVAVMSVTVSIGLAPFAAWSWITPTGGQLGLLAVVAVLATAGHYCMTRAFAAAPMTVTQPVTFLQLVWASLLGVLFFAEPVDPFVIVGGGIIVGAVSFITWREAVRRSQSHG